MACNTDSMIIHMFACLSDNYGFLVHDSVSGLTACIDTPDADAIISELEVCHWKLDYILNTHHHWDHAGGNLQLKEKYNCTIIGAAQDARRIPGIDIEVSEGDSFRLGEHEFLVKETPGHTSGHIVFYVPDQKVLFVGDTLFSVGCGRLFEGSAEQMWNSLQKIMRLPEDTLIYCAHEYTLNNIDFARSIDKSNPDLEKYYIKAKTLRSQNRPTIPTTLGREFKVNPFLRPADPGIVRNLDSSATDELALFTEIRKRKDVF